MHWKKFMARSLVLVLSVFLAACGSQDQQYQLQGGRFVLDQNKEEGSATPYLLLQQGDISVIQDIAVSYQPSGDMVVSGNRVVMETVYADEVCKWTFMLVDDNKLKFVSDESDIPEGWDDWKDGWVFVKSET